MIVKVGGVFDNRPLQLPNSPRSSQPVEAGANELAGVTMQFKSTIVFILLTLLYLFFVAEKL